MGIIVKTPAFKEGEWIPTIYTCDGEDISPEILWSNVPSETKSFALMMEDPDAPIGTFTHWVVYDIPPHIDALPENFPKMPEIEGTKQGINDFGKIGYGGPCPPPGKPHRYFFKLFAIDVVSLKLSPKATKKEVLNALNGHIIGTTQLMGLYKR